MNYKILFSVSILNEYYEGLFCSDFDLMPSMETQRQLSGYGLIYRNTGHNLFVLIRVDSDQKPLVPLQPGAVFSFYMRLKNPNFYNFSNVNNSSSPKTRYYFNNLTKNKIGSELYLSKKIAAYDGGKTYTVGSFATNASHKCFEAIRGNRPGKVHGTSNGNYWLEKGLTSYVQDEDQMEVSSAFYLFPCTAATDFTIDIFGLNPGSGNYTRKVRTTSHLNFQDPQQHIPFHLDELPSGKYRLKVNAEERMIYLDERLSIPGYFGLIEIFNHLDSESEFALFDSAGSVKNTSFLLRFASRSVIWKYQARTADVTAVEDSASGITFVAESGHQFISSTPVSLREKPVKTLLLKSAFLGDVSPLPNPRTDRLGRIVRNGDTYLCSELYLNY